ncbi:MAG: T9SS type A sorting domain-containing protein [Crocinitomix sp.]|nr:T9SS type A sorting domain-containing protein [Crocinitomix sp.]
MKIFTLSLLFLTGTFYSQGQVFEEHPIEQGIRNPISNVLADLDSDGDLDLITASVDDHKIGWYENQGDNEFLRENRISSEAIGVSAVYAADLDSDGTQDLLVALSSENSILYYPNDGSGVFDEPILISDLSLNVQSVIANDLDGDGDLDVLSASMDDNKIAWYENLGGGVFSSENVLTTAAEGTTSVLTGDLNGDGDIDIIASADAESEIIWIENLGGGTFSTPIIVTDLAEGISEILLLDFDEDGDIDILNSSEILEEVAWYENDGTAVFAAKEVVTEVPLEASHLAIADFNDDGEQDLLIICPNAIYWMEKIGIGLYDEITFYTFTSAYGHLIENLTVADVDGSGSDDILLGMHDVWGVDAYFYSYQDAVVLLSNEGGVFEDFRLAPTISHVNDIALADINEDGILDVVAASNSGEGVIYFPGLGDELYDEPVVVAEDEETIYHVEVGDLDGDGDIDIVYADGYYPLVYLSWSENLGLGVFDESVELMSGDFILSMTLADTDTDGDLDIYIRGGSPVSWIENTGSGTFAEFEEVEIASTIGRLNFFDMDDDGDLDLLTAYYPDNIAWVENTGGVFGDEHIIATGGLDDYFPTQLIMRDMDDDGDNDLITNARFYKKIRYFENIDGSYEAGVNLITALDTLNQIGVEDFDLDGDYDIVSLDIYGKVQTYENSGDLTFSAPYLEHDYPFTASQHYLEIIDADDDGDLDFFNCSKEFTNLSYFENLSYTEQQASGTVYFDDNMNGVMDGAEYGLSTIQILTSPFAGFSYSNGDGNYNIDLTEVADGTYSITPAAIPYWEITSTPEAHEIILDDLFVLADDLNFGIHPTEIVREVAPQLTSGYPKCDVPTNYSLTFQNTGSTIAQGQIHLVLNEDITFVSAEITPDLIDGDNIYWSYEDLNYLETYAIPIVVEMPGYEFVGVPLESFLTVTIDTLGDELFSTTTSLIHEFGCAWDPNDKTAIPAGEGDMGYISHETEWIEYKIRFQNTGTDTATNVVIEDQLDDNLDWLTLTPLTSSHDMEVSVNTDGVISFEFDNIMLPDSNVNILASQGFVKYKIALNPGLPVGTSIYNTADIYFDFNPAVTTNTKVHTLADNIGLEDESSALDQITVYPNPASEQTTVYFGSEDAGDYQIKIYNILGELVYSDQNLNAISAQINTSHFNKGMYVLVITSIDDGAQLFNTKLIVE